MSDLHYGLRTLLRSPGFTLVAVITLAVGIGANTAIFSVVRAVLLRSLPYDRPERLVMVWESFPASNRPRNFVSPANFLDWQSQNRVFEQMALLRDTRLNLTGDGEPEEFQGQSVSANFFSALGAPAQLGRTFATGEDTLGAPRVVVLSHRLWLRRFRADPGVIGRPLTLSGLPATVIGVMPADFVAPPVGENPEVWEPLRLEPGRDYRVGAGRNMHAVARLKSGVALQQAQLEMDAIARRLEEEHRQFNAGWRVNLVPMHEQFTGDVQLALFVLLGAAAFVLLIACVNVSNLLLGRAAARQREMSVRAALGASGWRLIRQLLAESVLLAGLGGALGLALAAWGTRALAILAPQRIPRIEQTYVDGQVLGLTIAVSLLTGIVFGLAPAFAFLRPNLVEGLKEGGARSGAGRGGQALRSALVVAEVALSMILLVSAGLLMHSFLRLQAVDPGFRSSNVLTLRLLLPAVAYRDLQQRASFFLQAAERIAALPGVSSAGAINSLPFSGFISGAYFETEGRPALDPQQRPVSAFAVVTPEYFRTMGIPLRRGRFLTEADSRSAPRVVVINQTMVRLYFPNEDPLRKRIMLANVGDRVPAEIVGVTSDVRQRGFDGDPQPMVYFPITQVSSNYGWMVVRSAGEPHRMAPAVVGAIRSLDASQPVAEVRTMDEVLANSVTRPRFNATLLGIFAAVAVGLALLGIYGVVAYAVAQRTREIGIRMALGATPAGVVWMVVGRSALLTGGGIVAGLAGSLGSARLMSKLLFGISPADPWVFGAVTLLLGAAALAAAWIPARRAARVNPMTALRHD